MTGFYTFSNSKAQNAFVFRHFFAKIFFVFFRLPNQKRKSNLQWRSQSAFGHSYGAASASVGGEIKLPEKSVIHSADNENSAPGKSVTRLLEDWSGGDESALEKLTPFVYDELRRLAACYLRNERADHTLQATALVHEAYLRLLELKHISWQNRAHFVGVTANLMRKILVDHARRRNADKRGSGERKMSLHNADNFLCGGDFDLVELDAVLENFSREFPRHGKIVELKFFGGLTIDEIVDVLNVNGEKIAATTVERDWRFARAWLHEELKIN